MTHSLKEQAYHCRDWLLFAFHQLQDLHKNHLSWNSTKGMLMNFYSQKLKCEFLIPHFQTFVSDKF